MCRGERRSMWTWWLRSTARRRRRRRTRIQRCASFSKMDNKIRILFLHFRRKRWKSLILVFFVSWDVNGSLREKGCERKWGRDMSIIISTQKFQTKIEWKSECEKSEIMGFLVELWYIRCGLSDLEEGKLHNSSTICLCFTKYYQLSFSLTKIKRKMRSTVLVYLEKSNKKGSKEKGHTVPTKVV